MTHEVGSEAKIEARGVILGPDGKVKGDVLISGTAAPETVADVFGVTVESKDAGNAPDCNP